MKSAKMLLITMQCIRDQHKRQRHEPDAPILLHVAVPLLHKLLFFQSDIFKLIEQLRKRKSVASS